MLTNEPSIYYRPQTKFAKVMFLQVSVCPHRKGMRGFTWGVCGFTWGACLVLFGGAWFYFGGACVVFPGGACMVFPGGHAWFFQRGHAWFFQFFRIQSDTPGVNEP